MIDTARRLAIVDAIDQYLNGDIDSFELDDVLMSKPTRDLACLEIRNEISRFLDDYSRHHYSDARLSREYEQGVVRWAEFLRTTEEWPLAVHKKGFLNSVFAVFQRKERTRFTENPYWPYTNEDEWKRVLQPVSPEKSIRGDRQANRQERESE